MCPIVDVFHYHEYWQDLFKKYLMKRKVSVDPLNAFPKKINKHEFQSNTCESRECGYKNVKYRRTEHISGRQRVVLSGQFENASPCRPFYTRLPLNPYAHYWVMFHTRPEMVERFYRITHTEYTKKFAQCYQIFCSAWTELLSTIFS